MAYNFSLRNIFPIPHVCSVQIIVVKQIKYLKIYQVNYVTILIIVISKLVICVR